MHEKAETDLDESLDALLDIAEGDGAPARRCLLDRISRLRARKKRSTSGGSKTHGFRGGGARHAGHTFDPTVMDCMPCSTDIIGTKPTPGTW